MDLSCEILTIGDELLRGDLVDGNAAWLAGRLTELGLRPQRIQSVGDGLEQIAEAVSAAASRCTVLVTTGGLGPTADDRTGAAVAGISERAEALPNDVGTAAGIALSMAGCRVFCLPGVPREMRSMFDRHVRSWVAAQLVTGAVARRTLRVFGLGEAQVEQRLGKLVDAVDRQGCEVSLHYRATFPEVHVIVIARAGSRDRQNAAQSVVDALHGEAGGRLGHHLYAIDAQTYAETIVGALREARATVALAESCTGGLAGDLLTRAPGSSEVFELGVVAYADRIKKQLLDVPRSILDVEGAVSRACVEAMARGVRKLAGSTYGAAISGIAGPGGAVEGKPVGTVHVAVAGESTMHHLHRVFPYSRDRNKLLAAYVALWLVLQQLRSTEMDQTDPFAGRWLAARTEG